jgi:hypothetical protein
MDSLEATIKEVLDRLDNSAMPRELWPMVVAAVVEVRCLKPSSP